MLRNLKVTRLCDNSFAYENILLHNKFDFDGKEEMFLECRGTIYRSLANNIEQGKIGVGTIQRNHHYLKLDQEIPLREVTLDDDQIINKLMLRITKRKKDNNLLESGTSC